MLKVLEIRKKDKLDWEKQFTKKRTAGPFQQGDNSDGRYSINQERRRMKKITGSDRRNVLNAVLLLFHEFKST